MAESQFYAILTDKGAALEATALATGVPVTLNKFVIGDGGGNSVTPDPTRTSLVHEVYRGNIKSAEVQGNQVTFTLYVPPEAGGYTIREAGILASDGTLYSLSNSPDILKPTESNGAVISITFKYVLAVSSTSTVAVVIYDNYLTPEAADKRYLQISKNLSEIKDKGTAAQKEGQLNLGIDLDEYYTQEQIDDKFNDLGDVSPVLSVNNIKPDANGNVNVSLSAFGAVNSVVYAGFFYTNETIMHYKPGDSIPGSLLFPAYSYRKHAELISETISDILFSPDSLAGTWVLCGFMPQSYEPTDGGGEDIFTASFATNFTRVA